MRCALIFLAFKFSFQRQTNFGRRMTCCWEWLVTCFLSPNFYLCRNSIDDHLLTLDFLHSFRPLITTHRQSLIAYKQSFLHSRREYRTFSLNWFTADYFCRKSIILYVFTHSHRFNSITIISVHSVANKQWTIEFDVGIDENNEENVGRAFPANNYRFWPSSPFPFLYFTQT